MRTDGRPICQWPRLSAGNSDDLGTDGGWFLLQEQQRKVDAAPHVKRI